MSLAKILWVDDEIDSLTSQIMFLENKGYEVATKTNGFDAVEFIKENIVDVVLMDEKGGKSTITATDLKASNGVIHVIDTVLMPK